MQNDYTHKGCLYGIGVGPGDPELLTLKALRILNNCNIIAHPGKTHDAGVALDCIRPVLQEFHKKTIVSCEVPMTKDKEALDAAYETNVSEICKHLNSGEDVAFLNLGEPTIYGSYMTIHKMVQARGYEAFIVPGIPSFCAATAALGEALCLRGEELHIIPASYNVRDALQLAGTKVFMKSGKKYQKLRSLLQNTDLQVDVVTHASMENELCYHGASNMPQDADYLTLVIVFDRLAK